MLPLNESMAITTFIPANPPLMHGDSVLTICECDGICHFFYRIFCIFHYVLCLLVYQKKESMCEDFSERLLYIC